MINVVQGTHGTEFDLAELPIEAGVGTIWVTQTQSPQVIVPDTQDTRRVMTFAPQGQEGAVWMRVMRSPLEGTSRWREPWKVCPTRSHALDELSWVHFSLDDPMTVRQGETCQHSSFVAFNAAHEAAPAL